MITGLLALALIGSGPVDFELPAVSATTLAIAAQNADALGKEHT